MMDQKTYNQRITKLEDSATKICDGDPEAMMLVLSETYIRVATNVMAFMKGGKISRGDLKAQTEAHMDAFARMNPDYFR